VRRRTSRSDANGSAGFDDQRTRRGEREEIGGVDVFADVGIHPAPARMIAVVIEHAEVGRKAGGNAHADARIERADQRSLFPAHRMADHDHARAIDIRER